jgi:hypothetical protein
MTAIRINTFYVCFFLLFFTIRIHAALLLPEGLEIQNVFFPGKGKPIGKVRIVQGTAYMMHDTVLKGYLITENMPIYAKDTLFVMEKSRASIILNDLSVLTFGSNTKMTFSRMEYVPESQYRSSYSIMHQGKGRFRVKDYKHFKQSSFSVKTPTALIGVRGSDFIIRATLKSTRVETLQKTRLRLLSLAEPDEFPVLLDEFEWVIIERGTLPSAVETLSPEEIESISNEFDTDPQDVNTNQDGTGKPSLQMEKSMDIVTHDETTGDPTLDNTENPTSDTESEKNNDDQNNQTSTVSDKVVENNDENISTNETNVTETDDDMPTKENETSPAVDTSTIDTTIPNEAIDQKSIINTYIPEEISTVVDINESEIPDPVDDTGSKDLFSPEDEIIENVDETVSTQEDIINDHKIKDMNMPWFPVRP